MIYDEAFFQSFPDRMGTPSVKWDECRAQHGADVLPMWVADMDVTSAEAVTRALVNRAKHPVYGYTVVSDADKAALIGYWQRRHGVTFGAEAIVTLPCVVTGLKACVRALTQPGDGVIIQSPVYGPFRMSVELNHRRVMDAALVRGEDGRYTMDLAAVEAFCRDGAKLMMLCNPHNPVGRAWSEEELRALLDILNRYGVPLVSDEIHADFVFKPRRHISVLALQRERVVMLCAPSKTFNVAGLQNASAVCEDEALRKALQEELEASGVESGNIFGLEAARAAYTEGDAWLDALMAHLERNFRVLREEAAEKLPRAVLTPLEATYLAWLDLRAWGYDNAELMRRTEQAGVIFTGGAFFGEAGDGFLRVNLGCPTEHVREAVARLAKALE